MRALLVGAVQVWSWEQAVSLYCHRFVIHSVDRYAFHCVFLENIVASRVKGRDLRALFSWILLSLFCCFIQMVFTWAGCEREMRPARSMVERLEVLYVLDRSIAIIKLTV